MKKRHCPLPLALTVLMLVGLLLGACNGASPRVTEPGPTAASSDTSLVVTDTQGRRIEFDAPPQRIVVAGKSSLTIIDALYLFPEAGQRLAGTVIGRQDPGDFLRFVDPSFQQKTVLAVDAGPEQIAPLKPDVVIMRSFMAEKLGRPLEQLDIPVVYVDLETPQQYLRDIGTLGQLFANEERAAEIEAYYRGRMADVEAGLQGLSEEGRPRTLIVQYSDQGGDLALSVPSAAWLQTMETELAGGTPVWKEAAQAGGWTVVNLEQIAAWNPAKVIVVSYKGDSAEAAGRLRQAPEWQALDAAQQGEIYGFGGDIFSWDQPDPRWILGLTWLAKTLHPERFADLDVIEAASQFYNEMYGLDEATFQEQIVPHLRGDF